MLALLQRGSLLLLVLLSLTTGCTSLSLEAEGPVPPGPPEGTARVYFVLSQGFPAAQAYIIENETLLGFLENEEYVVVDVPAGEHLFMLVSEQTEGVQGTFEAGKTYHMKLFVTPGFMRTRVYWTPLTNSGEDLQARAEDVAECDDRVMVNPAAAPKWEARYAERNRERVQDFRSGEDEAKTIGPEHGL